MEIAMISQYFVVDKLGKVHGGGSTIKAASVTASNLSKNNKDSKFSVIDSTGLTYATYLNGDRID